ncbi:hypothetical protein [Sediminispirochaeta bajacaliforniensis]|uniref:hypothetical protein n=1 Tax=Sediminispirochaeta bajacaliforniensis TaxID=148 RepID=UPI00036BCE00|nr:hypothetical protein [Sediminispirochaeta bajacaliforniensis]
MLETLLHRIRLQAYLMMVLFSLGLVAIWFMRYLGWAFPAEPTRVLSMVGLLGSTTGAVALPILVRMAFYRKSAHQDGLSLSEFFRMERCLVLCVLFGALFTLFAYLVPVYRYHLYLSVLVTIYGIYSVFPANKTYKKDIAAFRVKSDET